MMQAMLRKHALLTPSLVVVLLTAGSASAQVPTDTSFDLQIFQPSPHGHSFFTVESGSVPESLDVRASLFLNYAHRPLQLVAADGSRISGLVDHRFDAHFMGAISLFDRLSLALTIPVALYQGATLTGLTGVTQNLAAVAFGDLRLSPKVMILNQKRFFIDLAALVHLTLPTGNDRAFAGDRTVTFSPELVVGRRFGPVRMALNFNFTWRERSQLLNLVVEPELGYRFGLGFNLARYVPTLPLEIIGEIYGRTSAVTPFRTIEQSPLEWLLGGKWFILKNLSLSAGFGRGLLAGYGAPAIRAFVGLTFVPLQKEEPVKKGPPPDTDGDGILDEDDNCPRDPEDKDGFKDWDGCPEPDNDEDGIVDAKDKCPTEPEDKDAFQDDDGCPEADNDGDGIPDDKDKCPLDPEDKDGFEDEDGCPEADNDGDGIVDEKDKCPTEPEVINNVDDFDGCPDVGQTLIVVKKETIDILEKVQFETNSAKLSRKSDRLLQQVAASLKNHTEIKKVRIEGHTDNVGSPPYNMKLSQRRAESVRDFLIAQGVAADRLSAVGYGQEKPIAPNTSAKGREINRRVAFTILGDEAQ